ncbi:MAG: transporter [Acidobacteria bacterium]|nr:transporter [Acidobacteriota bacterium]
MRCCLVPWKRDASHDSQAGHPGSRRCFSLAYAQYARSSRLAIRAPRSGTYATHHASRGLAVALAAALLLPAAPARAQQTVNDIVSFLVTNQAVQTADFERDQAAAEAARATIARALLVNLASVPLATSSSGFLYRFNPQLGTVERATESFGGFFVERALTPGRGRAAFGVSATTSSFRRLDGRELRDGTLVTVANTFRDEEEPFDVETLTLRLQTSAMTLFGSVGVTDRLEIGAALPLVRLHLEGERINVYRGTRFQQASGTATANGIADLALRAKYTVFAGPQGGVAGAAELRLPTGDEDNLLGAGVRSWRVMGIGSFEDGRLGLHANAGLVRGGVSDEWLLAGAASFAVSPHVTISGELTTRHVSQLRDVALISAPHPTIDGVDTLRLMPGATGSTLTGAVAGFKWNVAGAVVLGGHLSWAMNSRGLTAPLTPTVALEYAF